MVGIKTFIKCLCIVSVGSLVVYSGVSLAKKDVRLSNRSPAMNQPVAQKISGHSIVKVFTSFQASGVARKTFSLFNHQTLEKLNDYAENILARTAFRESDNPLYIDNPDLHRMVCFFVNAYVYAAESQNLPKENQIYLVADDGDSQDQGLTVEIKNVQNIFNQCEKLELQLQPTGMVYFNWDVENVLNGIPVDIQVASESDVPAEFRDDPLLSQLFKTEAIHQALSANKDKFGDDMVNILLEGVKNQLASGHPNLAKLATSFAKQAGTKAYAERQSLVASLSKDDANLFSASEVQKETARALTNLIALPGKATVSKASFVSSIKKIMDSDIKLNMKVGKDMIYAGFRLNFK